MTTEWLASRIERDANPASRAHKIIHRTPAYCKTLCALRRARSSNSDLLSDNTYMLILVVILVLALMGEMGVVLVVGPF